MRQKNWQWKDIVFYVFGLDIERGQISVLANVMCMY